MCYVFTTAPNRSGLGILAKQAGEEVTSQCVLHVGMAIVAVEWDVPRCWLVPDKPNLWETLLREVNEVSGQEA